MVEKSEVIEANINSQRAVKQREYYNETRKWEKYKEKNIAFHDKLGATFCEKANINRDHGNDQTHEPKRAGIDVYEEADDAARYLGQMIKKVVRILEDEEKDNQKKVGMKDRNDQTGQMLQSNVSNYYAKKTAKNDKPILCIECDEDARREISSIRWGLYVIDKNNRKIEKWVGYCKEFILDFDKCEGKEYFAKIYFKNKNKKPWIINFGVIQKKDFLIDKEGKIVVQKGGSVPENKVACVKGKDASYDKTLFKGVDDEKRQLGENVLNIHNNEIQKNGINIKGLSKSKEKNDKDISIQNDTKSPEKREVQKYGVDIKGPSKSDTNCDKNTGIQNDNKSLGKREVQKYGVDIKGPSKSDTNCDKNTSIPKDIKRPKKNEAQKYGVDIKGPSKSKENNDKDKSIQNDIKSLDKKKESYYDGAKITLEQRIEQLEQRKEQLEQKRQLINSIKNELALLKQLEND